MCVWLGCRAAWWGGTSSELANVTSSQPGCGSYVIKGKLGGFKKKKEEEEGPSLRQCR